MKRILRPYLPGFLIIFAVFSLHLGILKPGYTNQPGKQNPTQIPAPQVNKGLIAPQLPGQTPMPTRQPAQGQPKKGIFEQFFGTKTSFKIGDFITWQRTYNEAQKTHNKAAMETTADFMQTQFNELASSSDIREEIKSEITHFHQTLVHNPLFRVPITEFTINFFITLLSQLQVDEKREKLLNLVKDLRSTLNQESIKLTSEQIETQNNIYKFSADLTKSLVPSLTKTWLEKAKSLASKNTFLALAALAAGGTAWYHRNDIEKWGKKQAKEGVEFVTKHFLKVTPYEIVEKLFRDGFIKEGIEYLIDHAKEVNDELIEELENNITGAEDIKGKKSKEKDEKQLLTALEADAEKAEKERIKAEAKYSQLKESNSAKEDILTQEMLFKAARREEKKWKNQYAGAKGWKEGRRTPKKKGNTWTSEIIKEAEYLSDLSERLHKARESTVVNIVTVALNTILEKMSNDSDKKKVISLIANVSPIVGGLMKEISSGQLEAEAEFHAKVANLENRIRTAKTSAEREAAKNEITRMREEQTRVKEANIKALSDLEKQLTAPTALPAIKKD